MQLSHTWNKQLEYPLHEQEHQVSAERHFLQQVIGKVPEMVLVALWNSWLIVFLGNPLLYIDFPWTLPPKSQIFQWTPKKVFHP